MLITQKFHSLNNQAGFHGFLPLLAIGNHKLNIDCSSKEIHDSLGANGIIRLIRVLDCWFLDLHMISINFVGEHGWGD